MPSGISARFLFLPVWAAAFAFFAIGQTAEAKGLTVLYAFQSGSDGSSPAGSLIFDQSGNLYGTTSLGGTEGNCPNAGEECGDVYKLAPDGSESILYTFCARADCDDGAIPDDGLIADAEGNFYGTTQYGGKGICGGTGCGTVFKLTPGGKESVLHSFKGHADGANPYAGLYADKSGNLYGTTDAGGGKGCSGFGCGTVFKIAPDGTETLLHTFTGGDGAGPGGRLIADRAGSLYGTTSGGGASGFGTVFKLSSQGTLTTLYSFTGKADGFVPRSTLVMDKPGNLYGTASYGGFVDSLCVQGCGTVFRIASDGTESTLYTFQGHEDGATPVAGLVFGSGGDLYGSTMAGGNDTNSGNGTVFKLTKSGSERVLYRFCSPQGDTCPDGAAPFGSLITDQTGNLYGTAGFGGYYGSGNCGFGCGTVWKIKE